MSRPPATAAAIGRATSRWTSRPANRLARTARQASGPKRSGLAPDLARPAIAFAILSARSGARDRPPAKACRPSAAGVSWYRQVRRGVNWRRNPHRPWSKRQTRPATGRLHHLSTHGRALVTTIEYSHPVSSPRETEPSRPDSKSISWRVSRVSGSCPLYGRQPLCHCSPRQGYFPAALETFSTRHGLCVAAALVILAAPTPGQAARLTRVELRALLKKAGRQRGIDAEAERLREVFRSPPHASTAAGGGGNGPPDRHPGAETGDCLHQRRRPLLSGGGVFD
ncbi:hypothetical protein GA0115254_10428 [Streptomyces sp. Ncost-T10-10d]|nr:hypothetical protein GA0115254_10428 [Streptomyces sp. Ncost-T10-10d]